MTQQRKVTVMPLPPKMAKMYLELMRKRKAEYAPNSELHHRYASTVEALEAYIANLEFRAAMIKALEEEALKESAEALAATKPLYDELMAKIMARKAP